jgi:hypothetical protein
MPGLGNHVFNREPAGWHRHQAVQQLQGGQAPVALYHVVPVAVRHHQQRLAGEIALVGDGSQHFQQAFISDEAINQVRFWAASNLAREAWVVGVEVELVDRQILQCRLVGHCNRGGSWCLAHSRFPIQTALPIISKSVAWWSMRISGNCSWSGLRILPAKRYPASRSGDEMLATKHPPILANRLHQSA